MFLQAGWECDDFDLVNGPHQDLSRDDLWTQILVKIRQGYYSAVFMGPPCSTFSRAREKQPGPRPLRTKEMPYGLPRVQLTEKEQKELKLGNFFMLMAAAAFRTAVRANVPVLFENPEPVQGHATAFDFDELRAAAALPGVATICFDQCRLGAETAKPTRLLAWGMDLSGIQGLRCDHSWKCWAWSDMHGRPRRSWGPHPPLAGRRRANGDFATKAAAAYPRRLNQALVEAAIAASSLPPPPQQAPQPAPAAGPQA